MKKLSLLALATLALSCGTGSVSNCGKTDWKQIGKIDQELGRKLSAKQASHAKACGDAFKVDEWKAGTVEGLAYHCTSDGTFWAAKNAGQFNTACPGVMHQEAWQDGRNYLKWNQEAIDLDHAHVQARDEEERRARDDNALQTLGKMMTTQESEKLIRMHDERIQAMRKLDKKYKGPARQEYP